MFTPKGSQDLYVERNATTVLAILALATFMALAAMLLILNNDRVNDRVADAPARSAATLELPSN